MNSEYGWVVQISEETPQRQCSDYNKPIGFILPTALQAVVSIIYLGHTVSSVLDISILTITILTSQSKGYQPNCIINVLHLFPLICCCPFFPLFILSFIFFISDIYVF